MQTKIKGVRGDASSTEVDIKAARGGALYTAQYLPKYALLAKAGAGVICQTTTALAIDVATPTTDADITLRNGSSNLYYILDRVFGNTEAYDAGKNFIFIWLAYMGLTAALTADISPVLMSGGSYSGDAQFDVNETIASATFHSWGNSVESNQGNAAGMSNIDVPIEGRIVIAPGHAISAVCGGNDSNITAQLGFSWFEVLMD